MKQPNFRKIKHFFPLRDLQVASGDLFNWREVKVKDPEQVIKTHYYRAKALEERFIRIRDSSSSKARKNAYNEDVKIHTAIAA